MRFSLLLSIVSAAFSAPKIAIVNPISGVVWKAGTQATVEWVSFVEKETDNINIDFSLVKGEPADLQPVEQLGSALGRQKTLTFTLSSELEQGTDYSIKYDAGVAGVNFSHYFTIDGKAPKPKPTTISVVPSSTEAARANSTSTPNSTSKDTSTSSAKIVTANLSLLALLTYLL